MSVFEWIVLTISTVVLLAIVGPSGVLIALAGLILGNVFLAILLAIFRALAQKTATDSGTLSKLQKQDERRYMPKEMLEQFK